MDFIQLFTQAKEMGLEIGQIASYIVLYLMLRRDVLKVSDKQFTKLIDAIKSLEATHNARINNIENLTSLNNKKLTDLEGDFDFIKQTLKVTISTKD